MPNDTGTVTAVYNSKGRPGGFHKAITIRSNANKPTKVLYIKGKAVKNLDEKKASPKQKEVSPVKKKKKGAQ